MNATSFSFGLLIVSLAILPLHRMRKLKPRIAGYGSQRMCPSCGLITSRLKACCLECGESVTAGSATPILWKQNTGALKAHFGRSSLHELHITGGFHGILLR
jgi:hypothetical protein